MVKYLCCFTLLVVGITSTSAFSAGPLLPSRQKDRLSGALFEKSEQVITYFEDLEKAVDCATKFGKCDVAVLHELADKVDAGSDSCIWEVDADLCQKEIDDRKDLASVLRLQAELRLRMDYIESANLFVDDVKAEHDIREREDEMELLSEDAM